MPTTCCPLLWKNCPATAGRCCAGTTGKSPWFALIWAITTTFICSWPTAPSCPTRQPPRNRSSPESENLPPRAGARATKLTSLPDQATNNLSAGILLRVERSPEFSSVHETRAQVRQGFGAVAQPVFHLLAQLGERLLITVWNKERIVAKAALPLRSKADMPFTYAIEQFGLQLKFVSVTNRRGTSSRLRQNRRQREHAAKARRPFLQRNVVQQMEQFGVVGAVRRVAGPARRPTVSTAHEPSPLPPFRLRQGYVGRVGHPLPLGGGEGWVRGLAVSHRG